MPLIFNAWLARFREDVLRRAGVPEQSPAVSRLDFVAWLLSADSDPAARSAWCSGSCEAMLVKALESAVAELATRLGPDPAAWRWGAVHRAVFEHPVLRFVPLLGRLTEASVPSSGDTTTINRQEALFGGFQTVHGPSYRAVYDLADLDRSRFIVVPGQSGNLLSSTVGVFLERWASGDTIALGPGIATAPITARIRLMPAGTH
ncbi:MAG: penicillin acylase family protein [Hyphomicrobiaceae bacterium]